MSIKLGAAISGPRTADKNFTDTKIFLRMCVDLAFECAHLLDLHAAEESPDLGEETLPFRAVLKPELASTPLASASQPENFEGACTEAHVHIAAHSQAMNFGNM